MADPFETISPDKLETVTGGGFWSTAKGFVARTAELPNPKHVASDLWHAGSKAGRSIGSGVSHLFGSVADRYR